MAFSLQEARTVTNHHRGVHKKMGDPPTHSKCAFCKRDFRNRCYWQSWVPIGSDIQGFMQMTRDFKVYNTLQEPDVSQAFNEESTKLILIPTCLACINDLLHLLITGIKEFQASAKAVDREYKTVAAFIVQHCQSAINSYLREDDLRDIVEQSFDVAKTRAIVRMSD